MQDNLAGASQRLRIDVGESGLSSHTTIIHAIVVKTGKEAWPGHLSCERWQEDSGHRPGFIGVTSWISLRIYRCCGDY